MEPLCIFATLPQEVRDQVYLFVLDQSHEEVDLYSKCKVANPLYDVSRKLRHESAAIAQTVQNEPCKHIMYSLKLPPMSVPNESITKHGTFDINSTNYHHNEKNTKQLRFLTGHLGLDVPLGIVFYFQLPEKVSYTVHGASAWTEKELYRSLDMYVNINIYNAKNFAFGPRNWLRAKDIEDTAVAVRMAVCKPGIEGHMGYADPEVWEEQKANARGQGRHFPSNFS